MARFSYSLDIALRMLMLLAYHRQRVAIPTMMEQLGVPYHNSLRVLRLLAEGGIIETRRGRGGGISLSKAADEINLKQVMDLVDGPIGLVYCKSHKETSCPIISSCTLKNRLSELEERINQLIEEVSLGHLIEGGEHAFTESKSA